jgi:hypothetical protein
MKEEILKAEQELNLQVAKDAKTRETLSTISTIGLPAFTIILLMLMVRDWMTARSRRNDLLREGNTFHSVPKQIMSLPGYNLLYEQQLSSSPSDGCRVA